MARRWECRYCGFTVRSENSTELINKIKRHIKENGGAILVYNTPDRYDEHHACVDLLTVGPPSETAVLFLAHEPEKSLHNWSANVKTWANRVGIIALNDTTLRGELLDDEILTNQVTDFSPWKTDSLKHLGELIVRMISKLDADCQYLTVCFDDFSTVINKFGNKAAFKIVTLFNAKMRESDAIIHYHMTPTEHLESTHNLFEEQFQLRRDLTENESTVSIL